MVKFGVYDNTHEANASLGFRVVTFALVPGLSKAHLLVPRGFSAPELPSNMQTCRMPPMFWDKDVGYDTYAVMGKTVEEVFDTLSASSAFEMVEDKRRPATV